MSYYEPISGALHNEDIFVSAVINPLQIDDYGTNRVRKVKTDKKDAFKPANYARVTKALNRSFLLENLSYLPTD
ncbi:MAG: IS110 family transposase [Oscillospiraceae bacterium]|nr:IS110 family transposase [Oscillospiraceae bacterium]